MKSSYKKLGPYIREVVVKNTDLEIKKLLGVSITKRFIPSIANTIGTDMSKYKIVRTEQFAYGPVTSRNGDKISVALLDEDDCIISTSYTVFEIIDTEVLDPEYLMMWFRRPEFDRYARYMSHGSVREIFGWEEMCDVELPIPHINKQREIVREYNVIVDRIKLNEQLNQKLEETAQAIYKQWFVDFEFPISKEYAESIGKPELEGKPYKSSGGEMVYCPEYGLDIPKQWVTEDLGNLILYKKGNAFKSSEYTASGVNIVRVSNFESRSIDINNCNHIDASQAEMYEQFSLISNDILISTVGSWPNNPASIVGQVVSVPAHADGSLLNQNIVRLRSKEKRMQYHIYFALANDDFSSHVVSGAQGSANQASVTLDHLFSYKIIVGDEYIESLFGSLLERLVEQKSNSEKEDFYLAQFKYTTLLSLVHKSVW